MIHDYKAGGFGPDRLLSVMFSAAGTGTVTGYPLKHRKARKTGEGNMHTFRFATEADVVMILKFILDLAEYEKMSDHALFFHNFSTFLGRAGIYLEDLFVMPEYRNRGYGKALLKKLAQITVERGCGRLEWACLDWNRPSIDFYLSLGAVQMNEWTTYRLTGETLNRMEESEA